MVLNSVRNVDRAKGKQDAPIWRQGKACATLAVSSLSLAPCHSASSVFSQAMSAVSRCSFNNIRHVPFTWSECFYSNFSLNKKHIASKIKPLLLQLSTADNSHTRILGLSTKQSMYDIPSHSPWEYLTSQWPLKSKVWSCFLTLGNSSLVIPALSPGTPVCVLLSQRGLEAIGVKSAWSKKPEFLVVPDSAGIWVMQIHTQEDLLF